MYKNITLEIDEKTSMVNVSKVCPVDIIKQFLYLNADYILELRQVENIENLISGTDFLKKTDLYRPRRFYRNNETDIWLNKYIAIKLALQLNPNAFILWKLCE